MYCTKCGSQMNDTNRFCTVCGAELSAPDPAASVSFPQEPQPKPKKKTEIVAIAVLGTFAALLIVLVIAAVMFFRQIERNPPEAEPEPERPVRSEQASEPAAQPETETTEESQTLSAQQIAQLSKSVVNLHVYDYYSSYISTGSGFIAFRDDFVVTNFHVVADAFSVFVETQDGETHYTASVIYVDEYTDLAVLQLEEPTGLTPLPLGDAKAMQVGDAVYAMGNPLDVGFTMSDGILSAIQETESYTDFQFTAPVSSGSSGGPLLNDQGQVIGVVYASYENAQNLNYAIPGWELEAVDLDQEPMEMYHFSFAYRSYGNSFENYSAKHVVTVETDALWLECMDRGHNILYSTRDLDEYVETGLQGIWPSIYRNTLYFLTPEGNKVCVYDLETQQLTENLLDSYPESAQVDQIRKLFVTEHGLTLIHETEQGVCALLQLDFNGSILGHLTDMDYTNTIMVELLEAAVSVPERNAVRYIPLENPSDRYDVDVSFSIGDRLTYGGGDWLYATDRENAAVIHRFNMYGDETETLTPEGWDGGAFSVQFDNLYYSGSGIWYMPVEGGERTLLTSEFSATDISFASFQLPAVLTDTADPYWAILSPGEEPILFDW